MSKHLTPAALEYLQNCQTYCSDRISDPSLFTPDSIQQNALRVETLRDISPRCGRKPPEHWHAETKNRGWGTWVFSGGCPSVFGPCSLAACPMRNFFLKSAPQKHIRKLAATEASHE